MICHEGAGKALPQHSGGVAQQIAEQMIAAAGKARQKRLCRGIGALAEQPGEPFAPAAARRQEPRQPLFRADGLPEHRGGAAHDGERLPVAVRLPGEKARGAENRPLGGGEDVGKGQVVPLPARLGGKADAALPAVVLQTEDGAGAGEGV